MSETAERSDAAVGAEAAPLDKKLVVVVLPGSAVGRAGGG